MPPAITSTIMPKNVIRFDVLSEQLIQAVQEKDRKKVKALVEEIDQLQKQLGPEFVALMNGLMHIDRRSLDGQEIALIMESLDQSCPHF
jgi:uncharacterized protein (UPF0210 family)